MSGHEGCEDVVRVAIQVLAGTVVAHGGTRVRVACGDLNVAEVHAGIETGSDNEGMAEHVRMRPGHLDPGSLGEVVQAAGGRVPVHLGTTVVEQDRASRTGSDRSMARPTAGGSGTRTILVPLPHTRRTRWPCSSPRSAMSAEVASKIRKPSRPSMATSAKSYQFGDWRSAVSRASNCRWVNPRVGDSVGTEGRRTCSAGECSRMPSRAQVR
jgi:hypothetical protein